MTDTLRLRLATARQLVHGTTQAGRLPHAGRLVRAVGWNAAGTVLARLLTLASSVVVARTLGAEGFGAIGVLQQTVTLAVTVTALGLPTTLTTDLAAARAQLPDRVGALVGAATLATALVAACAALLLSLGGDVLAMQLLGVPTLAHALPAAGLLLLAQSLGGMQLGALAGLEQFRSVALITVLSGVAAFAGAAVGARVSGVTGAITGLAIGATLTAMVAQGLLATAAMRAGSRVRLQHVGAALRHLAQTARATTLTNMLVVGTTWFTAVTVAHQSDGVAAAGLLMLGTQWRAAVLALPLTAATPLLSILSSLRENGAERERLGTLAWQVAGALALLGAMVVALASPWLVRAYGSGFSRAVPVLLLMVSSAVPLAVAGMQGQLALGRGDRRSGVLACACWSATLIVATLLLVPSFGAVGAALATLLAAPVQVLVLWRRTPITS